MDLGQSYVSSEVRGTFGYVDPEYRKNHHVNASGDVYSFGMVLLQILSGQRVINLNLNIPMSLNKTVRNNAPFISPIFSTNISNINAYLFVHVFAIQARLLTDGGKIEEFADPKLRSEYSMEAFDLVFKLALSCTGLKQQRPSMEQVVQKMETALNISTQFNSLGIERTKTFSYSSIHE